MLTPTRKQLESRHEFQGSAKAWIGQTLVRVVYSDESGTDKDSPICVVAAYLVNIDTQWPEIEADLQALPFRKEFKGKGLYKDIRNQRYYENADEILRGMLSLAKKRRCPIFYGAIDRISERKLRQEGTFPSLLPSHKTFLVSAFDACFQRVDQYVHTLLPGEQILWIADHNQMAEEDINESHRFFDMVSRYDPLAVGGTKALLPEKEPRPSHIVDTIYYGDSAYSRALQLADVFATTIRLHLQKDPIVEPYYELIRKNIVNEGMGASPM